MANRKRKIKERVKARRANRTFYDLVVGDGDLAGLSAALTQAQSIVNATKIVHEPDAGKKAEMVAAAERIYDEALAAVESHRDRIWFEALPDEEYEAIRLLHPPKPPEKGLWSLIPALLAACAVDDDSTADDWAEALSPWSRVERDAISVAVVEANTKTSASILGKG